MSDIIKTDPYIPLYAYEKAQNPARKLVWRSYNKNDVEFVDRINELAESSNDTVRGLADWDVVFQLFDYFTRRWPEEYQQFKGTIDDIRHTRRAGGLSETRQLRYVAALPPRFERLIRVVFPKQQFNKIFIYKLIRKMGIFKVGGEKN